MKKYLTVEEVLFLHKTLIVEFGGSHGIRDMNALESAVGRVYSGYYSDIYEEAAALMESLAINHSFIDGNKRIAFFATDVFLRINGYFIDCDNEKAYRHFMNLFNRNQFRFDELLKWLRRSVKILTE
ncbi:type II toxin-antitoxin system death-on-curing family toxin [candidate division KSB1 bacterium]|nr:type II toxin-antitoxin system death-on-curing family toxin [candidate division KSB1 bacterium]